MLLAAAAQRGHHPAGIGDTKLLEFGLPVRALIDLAAVRYMATLGAGRGRELGAL